MNDGWLRETSVQIYDMPALSGCSPVQTWLESMVERVGLKISLRNALPMCTTTDDEGKAGRRFDQTPEGVCLPLGAEILRVFRSWTQAIFRLAFHPDGGRSGGFRRRSDTGTERDASKNAGALLRRGTGRDGREER